MRSATPFWLSAEVADALFTASGQVDYLLLEHRLRRLPLRGELTGPMVWCGCWHYAKVTLTSVGPAVF